MQLSAGASYVCFEGGNMTQQKFDEHDRKKVIAAVEKEFAIKLSPVGSRKKYLQDEVGKTYWIFGGYEDWHGIPPDMMEAEEKRTGEGVLIVAKRYKNNIDIFAGDLRQLIDHKRDLSKTVKGDYQFNIRIRGDRLFIKEVTGLTLKKLGAAAYTGEEKESDKKFGELEALVGKLTPEQRKRLLEELAKQ